MSSTIKVNNIQNLAGDDSGFDLSTNDVVAVKTANTERMRVDANGNVGIGTSSLTGGNTILDLHKSGSGVGTNIAFANDHNTDKFFVGIAGDTSGDALIFNAETSNMIFGTNNSERMRIDNSGNLFVNCTSTGGTNQAQVEVQTTGGSRIIQTKSGTTGNTNALTFNTPSGQAGAITTNTTSTTYSTSSDYRLKENVTTSWDATSRIKELKPCRFNFKADKDTTVDGFLAHEVSSIVPESIIGKKDAVDADGNIEPQGIDQSKLVPLLTKALQEAVAKIETLEAKVTALEGK